MNVLWRFSEDLISWTSFSMDIYVDYSALFRNNYSSFMLSKVERNQILNSFPGVSNRTKKILLLQDIWLPLADSCSLQGSIHYAKGPFRLELGKPWFLRGHNFLFDTKASLGAISRQIPESVSKLSCRQKSLYLYCAHMYQLNAPPPQQQHFEPVRCPEGVKL